jgi:signal transduction histidine kinase
VASSPIFAGTPALPVMLGSGVLAVQSTPLVTRDGQILGMLSTHYDRRHRPHDRDLRVLDILARQTADLLERKRSQVQLAQSRETFQELVERAPFGIYVVDSNFQIVQMNAGSQQKTFQNVKPIIGRDLGEAMHIIWPTAIADEIVAAFRQTLTTGRPYFSPRFTSQRSDIPSIESYEWELHRIMLPDARYGVICYYFDSTELRNVEAALRSANENLEQFAFSASHDLKEPLRALKVYSELLTRELNGNPRPEIQKYIEYIHGGASRMENLVADLLAYTGATAFEQPAETIDANEVLQNTISDLANTVAEAGARITADPLPSVRVHYTHLQQLLQNLIGNAIKYRSPHRPPEIHLSAGVRDGSWVFTVRDNGIGIDPEYKEKIFGLFKRLHNTNEYSGTGIGLAICKRIIDRYQGQIWVESEPGNGSTFHFTLPVWPAPTPAITTLLHRRDQ